MVKNLALKASNRSAKLSAVRRAGSIPAVLYGHGLDSSSLQLDAKEFGIVFKHAGHTSLIKLDVEGEDHTVLIRQIQYHPVTSNLLHIDLYQVNLKEAIRAQVPIDFQGEAPAVRDLGGVMLRNLDELDLEALPNDLPHDIPVDISVLDQFDQPIRISDLTIPDTVKLFHEPNDVVALVQPPRTEEELEALTEEVTEDVEGVEGVEDKPAEGEEGEEAEGAEGDEAKAESDETKTDEPEKEHK